MSITKVMVTGVYGLVGEISDRQWIDMEHAREVIGYVAQDKAEDFLDPEVP